MIRRRSAAAHSTLPADSASDIRDCSAAWCLRLLIDFELDRCFTRASFFGDEKTILEALGLGSLVGKLDELPAAALRKHLVQRYRKLAPRLEAWPPVISRNLALLHDTLPLNPAEERILVFTVLMHYAKSLYKTTELFGDELTTRDALELLARILQLSFGEVQKALAPEALLPSLGLVRVDARNTYALPGKLDLMPGLADFLLIEQAEPDALLNRFCERAAPPTLRRADFAHCDEDYRLCFSYLQAVLEKRTAGVNILLYGQSGTGKTEFVRTVAEDLAVPLYEVKIADEDDGEPLTGARRLSAYQLAQRLLGRQDKSLLLFDEIEDVFPQTTGWFGPSRADLRHKAWMNRVSESNTVPTIWVSNAIEQIDPAYLRRFDLILEFTPPPQSVRQRMIERHLHEIPLRRECVERLASCDRLVPAYIERAVKVVRHLPADATLQIERSFERVLGNTLQVIGYAAPLSTCEPRLESLNYRLDWLNPDRDLASILEGLKRHRQGRLCFYGPPGTGKSALAQHIAKVVDRPLRLKRASDLLSPYLGETEQRIAQLFREAAQDQAVLVIDEADSFLRDRASAQRAWEVTQVNELLVQIEHFTGILIMSTNLVETLDGASLRRFDFKIRFDYLTPDQVLGLFADLLAKTGADDRDVPEGIRTALRALYNLTPGDFANVFWQVRLTGGASGAEALLERLAAESRMKPGAKARAIGFVTS